MTALLVSGCSGSSHELYVSAAASLSEVFAEIEAEYEAAHPETDVILNLGGSSALGYQITEGASIDVFASADEPVMMRLADEGWTTSPATPFASNRLQIVVPEDNPGEVTGLESLTATSLLVGACSSEVPCGRLADAVLKEAGLTLSFDTRELNVKAVLTKVAEGELDAGLVYISDTDPTVIGIPIESDLVNIYPIATISESAEEASEFVAFVLSTSGLRHLSDAGFGAP